MDLELIIEAFIYRTHWQYEMGDHSSNIFLIIGSIAINLYAKYDTTLQVGHLVLSGSSQWVFRRNIASKRNIVQPDNKGMEISGHGGKRIRVPIA